jgi:hypothetical protein
VGLSRRASLGTGGLRGFHRDSKYQSNARGAEIQTKNLKFLTTMPKENQNPIQKAEFSTYVGLTTRP